jgi:hypothetical protein
MDPVAQRIEQDRDRGGVVHRQFVSHHWKSRHSLEFCQLVPAALADPPVSGW